MKRKSKKKPYQTGRSNKTADRQRKARKPGKRKSKSDSTYTERRKNRSDMPGKLTGLDKRLEQAIKKAGYIDNQIKDLRDRIRSSKSPAVKESYRQIIKMRKKQLRLLNRYIRRSR